MAIVRRSTNDECWRGCGEKGTFLHCWWECKSVQPLWKRVWKFLRKLNTEPPHDPAIPFPGTYPDKTTIQKDTCTCTFTAALFTIARTWQQPKCPSTEEQTKKMQYTHTRRGVLLGHEKEGNPATCNSTDEPQGHFLSEISHNKISTYGLTYTWNLKTKTQKSKFTDTENRLVPVGGGQRMKGVKGAPPSYKTSKSWGREGPHRYRTVSENRSKNKL